MRAARFLPDGGPTIGFWAARCWPRGAASAEHVTPARRVTPGRPASHPTPTHHHTMPMSNSRPPPPAPRPPCTDDMPPPDPHEVMHYVSLEQAEAALQRGLQRCAAVLQQLGPAGAAAPAHPAQRRPGGQGPSPRTSALLGAAEVDGGPHPGWAGLGGQELRSAPRAR